MKNAILLLAACAFTTASFAQTPSTEVSTRNNGTKKIVTKRADGSETVTKTGKTNVGAALENSTDAAGNLIDKAGKKIKHGSQKGSRKLRTETKKMEKKSE
ncbi:MAG: hypothetical protein EOO62_28735 [Hymenobacter sp.]|nr:MAG: hypothetical protein EOO62_28735 [Hymenobacter sp.]